MLTRRLALAVLLAAALAVAGCALDDPTTSPPRYTPGPAGTPPTRGQPPTTATTSPAQSPDCPLQVVECPRPWITPGAVIASTDGVCSTSYNPRRTLGAAAKRRLLTAYGLPADQKTAEIDHLIPRWAGGTSTTKNLWPAVDPAQVARKDALEAQLYRAVCVQKTMTLATARDRALHFWRYWPAKFTAVTGGDHD